MRNRRSKIWCLDFGTKRPLPDAEGKHILNRPESCLPAGGTMRRAVVSRCSCPCSADAAPAQGRSPGMKVKLSMHSLAKGRDLGGIGRSHSWFRRNGRKADSDVCPSRQHPSNACRGFRKPDPISAQCEQESLEKIALVDTLAVIGEDSRTPPG